MKDKVGRTLDVGDVVLYATRDSCFPYLNYGVITRVEEDYAIVRGIVKNYRGYNINKQVGKLEYSSRVFLIPSTVLPEFVAPLVNQIQSSLKVG